MEKSTTGFPSQFHAVRENDTQQERDFVQLNYNIQTGIIRSEVDLYLIFFCGYLCERTTSTGISREVDHSDLCSEKRSFRQNRKKRFYRAVE